MNTNKANAERRYSCNYTLLRIKTSNQDKLQMLPMETKKILMIIDDLYIIYISHS